MSWVPDRYRELRSLLRPERLEDDVDEELAFHLEQRAADLQAAGMSAVAAREEARRRFGSMERFRDQTVAIDKSIVRERRRMEFLDSVRRETRHSLRSLVRAPAFTVVAVLTLALGVGATTAIYSLIDAVVLRPLPYADADRLIRITHRVPGVAPDAYWDNSVASYFYYTDNARTLEALGAYSGNIYSVSDDGEADRVTGAMVTPSLFEVLGARPSLGRLFTDDELAETTPPVVVISHELWQSRYGGDPDIVGREIRLATRPTTIIGVLPPGLHLLTSETHIWRPLRLSRADPPENSHWVTTLARMRPGVTPDVALADIQRLTQELPNVYPRAYGGAFMESSGFRAGVTTVREEVLGGIERVLWMLLGAVGIVLLIACANVANLLLVRAEGRRREQTVRAALGAERAHFAVHYLTESALLAVAAGVFGTLVAYGALQLLLATAPATVPRLDGVALGLSHALFAVGLALLTGLIFGLVPTIRERRDFSELRESGRGLTASRDRQLVRGGLIVMQVGLALVLLVAGGLMLRSLMHLRDVDLGVDTSNVLTFQIVLPSARYPTAEDIFAFQRELTQQLEALPEVASVGGTTHLPLGGGRGCAYTTVEGVVYGPADEPPCLPTIFTQPGYFESMGIRVQGEIPTWSDMERRAGGVVVSRSLANRLWPGEDPIGRGIMSFRDGPPWYRVVGVANDVRSDGVDEPPIDAIYFPALAIEGTNQIGPFLAPNMVVRTTTSAPEQLQPTIRRIVAAMDPEVPVANVRSMDEVVASSPAVARTSFTMLLLGVSAGLALFLSAVGLYGVIAYLVGRRRGEIGIRMALGAHYSQVARLVVLQSVRLTAIGIAVGVVASLLLTRVLRSLLFGVEPADPGTLIGVSVLLLIVAVLAAALPAIRAARTDPSEALRTQ